MSRQVTDATGTYLINDDGSVTQIAGPQPQVPGPSLSNALESAGKGAATSYGTSAVGGALGVGGGPLSAIAGATYLGGKSAYDELQGKKDNSIPGQVGRVSLAIATGGLSELGRGLFGHQSTKDVEAQRWGDLQSQGVTGAQAAQLSNHPVGDTGKWTTGKYAGQDWSFDKAADLAKDDPSQFRTVYGNLDTFGNDWMTKYSPGQQDAITKNVLNAGLYDGQKGDIVITDKDKAKQIAADTIANYKDPTPAATTQSTGNTRPQTRAPSLADVPLISSLAFQPITVPDYSKAVNPTIKNKYL